VRQCVDHSGARVVMKNIVIKLLGGIFDIARSHRIKLRMKPSNIQTISLAVGRRLLL
jgi:hypothetical protein